MSRPVVRFTLSSLIGLIAVLGLGMAAMRSGSDLANRSVFNAMLAALFVGLLGALVGRGGAWVGFALFGWGFAGLTFGPVLRDEFGPRLLTKPWAQMAADRVYNIPPAPDISVLAGPIHLINGQVPEEHKRKAQEFNRAVMARGATINPVRERYENSAKIFQSILVLVIALVGAVVGRLLSPRCATAGETSA